MKIEIEIKLSQKEVEESRSYQKKQYSHTPNDATAVRTSSVEFKVNT